MKGCQVPFEGSVCRVLLLRVKRVSTLGHWGPDDLRERERITDLPLNKVDARRSWWWGRRCRLLDSDNPFLHNLTIGRVFVTTDSLLGDVFSPLDFFIVGKGGADSKTNP
ncbi:hypothetical protein TNCT_733721 [Trichonephila clavata]|uniref:Uncharacterized protein n=1 Tax=Trichonephila clavata TaxID=2740835 RepID=A0A8X6G8H3_TRICU|nr:hypothetical protein TNCT_733721 [Trichonephila clavata]